MIKSPNKKASSALKPITYLNKFNYRAVYSLFQNITKKFIKEKNSHVSGKASQPLECRNKLFEKKIFIEENFYFPSETKILIHLHAFYFEETKRFLEIIETFEFNFDFIVTVPIDCLERNEIIESVSKLPRSIIKKVILTPNRGRDLASFLVECASGMETYEIVGHFHTKRSPHDKFLGSWYKSILDELLGECSESGRRPAAENAIMLLTRGDASIVGPQSPLQVIPDPTGWGLNKIAAANLLKEINPSIRIPDIISFPEGSMFWARCDALRPFLRKSWRYDEFPEEPIGSDGSLAHAIERILFLVPAASGIPAVRLCAHTRTSADKYYEIQRDYSLLDKNSSIKVLAYYLPQFYPTPENDEWHGIGFTEWTKVKSSQPQFEGHLQRREPHASIGYYQYSSGLLKKQAEMMRAAGVDGLIFYHYWFNGKKILEKPAEDLLRNSDIPLNFCFCWANENWTRRWDGSEDEILLQQLYSSQDAHDFITHLIPYFKDERYIRRNGRPLIFIYRPEMIPTELEYINVWNDVCRKHSIGDPYVIGTYRNNGEFLKKLGCEAGAERVLYDWTNGAVHNVDDDLVKYHPLVSSVLNYRDVSKFYIENPPHEENLKIYRSIVPCFDNTPRYGHRANILHNPNPDDFMAWMAELYQKALGNIQDGDEYILVNAWNEWAETAMLEPDSIFGYAYLNAIGSVVTSPFLDSEQK